MLSQSMFIILLLFSIPLLWKIIKEISFLMMDSNKITRNTFRFIENVLSEKNIVISKVLFILIFSVFFYFSIYFKLNIFEYDRNNYDMISIYGLVISILSMYGIYIGFLQFIVTDSEKVRYLGKNKIRYLTETSMWYQMTQTKYFIITLSLLMICPLFIEGYSQSIGEINFYLWQTSAIILLLIYIFLLSMSIKIIRILFYVKDGVDIGLETAIGNSITNKYYDKFYDMYKDEFNSEKIKSFFYMLEFDFFRTSDEEIDQLLGYVFSDRINSNFISRFGNFQPYKYSDRFNRSLYMEYKRFLFEKWSFLNKNKNKISIETYTKFVHNDEVIVDKLMEVSFTEIIKEQSNIYNFSNRTRIVNAHMFLFDNLLDKCSHSKNGLTNVIERTNKSTESFSFKISEKSDDAKKYYEELEKYKWEQVLEKCLTSDLEISQLYHGNTLVVDDRGLEYYSKQAYNFLIEHHGIIDVNMAKNLNFQKIINSMDEIHRIAYSMYQLFPNNYRLLRDNLLFFLNIMGKIFEGKTKNKKKEIFFDASKKVIDIQIFESFDIDFFNKIYKYKQQVINEDVINYFENRRVSPILIMLVQNMLYSYNNYSVRIGSFDNSISKEVVNELAVNYLSVIDKYPDIVKYEGLNYTMRDVLCKSSLELSVIVRQISLVGLCYYDYVSSFESPINFQNDLINYIRNEESFCFHNSTIYNFLILKITDKEYEELFTNSNIKKSFIIASDWQSKSNLSIEEYLNSLYLEIKEISFIEISKIKFEKISSRFKRLLFE